MRVPEPAALQRFVQCRRFAAAAGLSASLIALAVLTGWALDAAFLKRMLPGAAAMKPWSAVSFALLGLFLWLLSTPADSASAPARPSRLTTVRFGCAAVALLGALTLGEHAIGLALGFDGLLFPRAVAAGGALHPGRMAPGTAFGAFVLAIALGGLARPRPVRKVDQFLALGVIVWGGLALEGYLFGVAALYRSVAYSSMAPHSAFLLVLLGAGALCARPAAGIMGVVNSDYRGGELARRLLPLVVIVPLVAGWLRWQGELAGWYDTALGLVLFIATNSLLLAGLVWLNARRLNKLDEQRRRAEEELHTSQNHLLAALEAGGMGVWIWDVERDQVQWDESVLQLMGLTPQDVAGQSLGAALDLLLPEDRERIQSAFAAALAGGADPAGEFRILQPDGTVRWLAFRARLERATEGRPLRMTGVNVDITARKRSEELQLRSQKLEALGTLAGGIAHDFNNILLAITGNTKLALEDLAPDHPVRESLLEIERAGTRAASLVRRILTFSRTEEPKREVIQLRPVVEEALRLVRATLPAMIEIRTRLDGQLPAVLADATQIHQIVVNLATNSLHAIEPNPGRIELRLDLTSVGAEQVAGLAAGTHVRLTVVDDGCGMSRETLARIFDPFFTTKAPGSGTGLGLSVVHGIMKSHQGAVTVYSEEGRGTRFHLYFPAVQAAAELAAPQLPAASNAHGEHVLYVDDEEPLAVLAARLLQRLGYGVTAATDPHNALATFRSAPAAFDVVITDLAMPGMSGFDLARQVLAVRPDVPVVMTSGLFRPEDYTAADLIGIRELIPKPGSCDELGEALDRVLRDKSSPGRAPESGEVSR